MACSSEGCSGVDRLSVSGVACAGVSAAAWDVQYRPGVNDMQDSKAHFVFLVFSLSSDMWDTKDGCLLSWDTHRKHSGEAHLGCFLVCAQLIDRRIAYVAPYLAAYVESSV